jgi:hypothetical protein
MSLMYSHSRRAAQVLLFCFLEREAGSYFEAPNRTPLLSEKALRVTGNQAPAAMGIQQNAIKYRKRICDC